ncbi:hypothetical protein BBJ28_00004047 [Nothophytophthora sp. Chile5]|nr:hypothetical protein BBJ28_00004047 [Nothophytophthora sp. Chile5]
MAPGDFPLPRALLPKLAARAEAHKAAKQMMERMLEHTVRAFESHTYNSSGVVDVSRWRALSRAQAAMNGQHDDHVTLYSERDCGETSTSLVYALQDAQSSVSATANGSALAALTPAAVLVAGRAQGKLENVMYALGGPHSQEGLALFAGFMYDNIADCGVLHTLEDGAREDEASCRFLGYKYVVKRSVASNVKLVRHRDLVYLESTGYTHSSSGERLGFHMEHSVDVSGFPDLHDRNSARALQSVRYIFRQKNDRIVEIFMLGNLDLTNALGAAGSNGSVGGDLFSISRLLQCAEARRLTLMVRRRRESIELLQISSRRRNSECYLCRRTKRFFSGSMLAECDVCGQFVCSKCRNDKKLFVPDPATDGLLGKFQKAQTCKTCVLVASAGYAPPAMHMLVSQQVTKNQGSDKMSNAGSGSVSGRRHSGSSGSRASSTGGRSNSSASVASSASASSKHESEFRSYRQGTVYTFPEVDEEREEAQVAQQQAPQAMSVQQQEEEDFTAYSGVKSSQAARKLLSSRMLGRLKEQSQQKTMPAAQTVEPSFAGPSNPIATPTKISIAKAQQRQPSPMMTPKPVPAPQSISISKARSRSTTASSTSSTSSNDSSSGRGRKRIVLIPEDPSKLYQQQQEHQRRKQERERHTHHHNEHQQLREHELREKQRQQKEQQAQQIPHLTTEQAVAPRGNCQLSRREKALVAYRANQQMQLQQSQKELKGHIGFPSERGSLPVRASASPYSNSYSTSRAKPSHAGHSQFPQFPHSSRGLRRATSTPTAPDDRRSDLMAQMVALSKQAESTYNATQRNGAFLSQQQQVHAHQR